MAADLTPERLHVFNGGLMRPGRVRRILTLAGLRPVLGMPKLGDLVGVWGQSTVSTRGEAIATRRGAALLRIEDAFLRSIWPGRMGEGPLGLVIDRSGVHFDASRPSDLETLLATHPLDDPVLLSRARDCMDRLRTSDLSKYNLHDPGLVAPDPGYVLVVDQVLSDASVRASGAMAATFDAMLTQAMADHPNDRIVIRTHPEAALGLRAGAFGTVQGGGRITLLAEPVSPWALLADAKAVYTLSSHLGFEAILAGHRPRVFGQPFYAGWGLTQGHPPLARRSRTLTPEQLFAAAMILFPVWYDPCRDRLCPIEDALDQLEAEVRAFRQDRHGHVAIGMRLWKRPRLQAFFGREQRLRFADDPTRAAEMAQAQGRTVIAWAGLAPAPFPLSLTRVEDGFLRSRGLGADLVPPLSLVADDLGIYYDPGQESRLERLIGGPVPPGGEARAERLVALLTAAGLSKYNTGGSLPLLPPGHRILVPGQVEDDASILLGAGAVRTNLALLRVARQANPAAVILYKPHPDVEAGMRPGAIVPEALAGLADVLLTHTDPALALAAVREVWTMTSLLGFEALIRGLPVTCLGAPFYAGWGLTRDLGPIPDRRRARPTLLELAHAVLIAYPRYYDPVSRLPCPPEVATDRLGAGLTPSGPVNRVLAMAQGMLATRAALWR